MAESEVFVFVMSVFFALMWMGVNSTSGLHGLYFRGNPAPGVVRGGLLLSMAWIWYVLLFHADPSVTAIYVLFYLVMGYGVVKLFGQTIPSVFGLRFRVDVVERRNLPAGVLLAAFILATGLIFGGSLWGDADPVGDDEGGWWIPVSFFLLGWGCLVVAFRLFLRREKGRFMRRVRQERSMADARAGALFLAAAAVTLTDAVSGDFWGWQHGLTTFGVLAGLLITQEFFRSRIQEPGGGGGLALAGAGAGAGAPAGDGVDGGGAGSQGGLRRMEGAVYMALALGAWVLNRFLDLALRNG